MTTAQLSVGLNTQPAFAELALLKTELKTLANNPLNLSVGGLRGKVTEALAADFTIKLRVSDSDLRAKINSVFGTRRVVKINEQQLETDLKTAFSKAQIKIGRNNLNVNEREIRRKLELLLQNIPFSAHLQTLGASAVAQVQQALSASHGEIRDQVNEALKGVQLTDVNAKIGVDPTHLMTELRRILAANPVDALVGANGKLLTGEVHGALAAAFATPHTVRVNTDLITAGVRAAVLSGLANVNTLPKAGKASRPRGEQLVQPDFTVDQIQRKVDDLNREAQALLTRAGRRPASGSDKRRVFDSLSQQIANFRQVEFPKAEAFEKAQVAAAKNAVLKLSIDKGHIAAQVAAALGGEHKLNVDLSTLSAQIAAVMGMEHVLNINTSNLAGQVKTAVNAGAAGAKAVGRAAPAVAAVAPVFQHAALLEALVPAMDRMVGTIEDSFKGLKARAIAQATDTPLATGSSGRRVANVGPDFDRLHQLKDVESLGVRNLGLKTERERLNAWFNARKAADAALNVTPQYLSMAAEARAKAQALKAAEQATFMTSERHRLDAWFNARKAADAALNVTPQYLSMAAEARAKAQALKAAEQATFMTSERHRLDAWFNARKASDAALNVTPQYLSMAAEARAKAQLVVKAEGEAFQRALNAEMARALHEARKTYTNTGARIAAAQVVAANPRFGAAATRGSLGAQGHLLDRGGELPNLRKGFDQATGAGQRFNNMMREGHSLSRGFAGSLGAMWMTWGSMLPLIAGAALGATIRSVFTVGKDLEYQLKFVSVLADGATVSMAKFGDAVRGTQVAPVQAAEALRGLTQNGLSAQEALRALPTILNLATAGEMGLAEAALGATGVMAAFNLEVSDLGRVSDVFAKAAASSNTSVTSMVESMKQASTVADRYGVSLEEAAGALAVLAQRNILGTAAGTSYRTMMDDLAAPTDRAKAAMAKMGLNLYDSNNQLKNTSQALAELRGVFLKLNQEGQNAFLGEIFEKRGAKAASALLANFSLYNQMVDELKNDTAGFAAQVVQQLGETTQGKFKRLVSEFQLSAGEAFDRVSDSAKNFMDQLRIGVASTGFKDWLTAVSSGLVNLTIYLTGHIQLIGYTTAAWLLFKTGLVRATVTILGSLIPALGAKVAALKVAEFAFLGLRVSAKTAWTAVTGGIGLVAILAAEWFLFARGTDAATEAMQARENAARLMDDDIERQIRTMTDSNAVLREETRLLWEGVDAVKAKADAQKKVQKDRLQTEASGTALEVLSLRQELEAIRASKSANRSRGDRRNEAGQTPVAEIRELNKREERVKADLAKLESVQALQSKGFADVEKLDALKAAERADSDSAKLARAVEAYNEQARNSNKENKTRFEILDSKALGQLPSEQSQAQLENARGLMNRALSGYQKTPRGAESAAARQLKADKRHEIELIKENLSETKRLAQEKMKLDELRYSSDRFGPEVAAAIAEANAIDGITQSLEAQQQALSALGAFKAKNRALLQAHPEEAKNLETDELRLKQEVRDLQSQLAFKKTESAIKGAQKSAKVEDDFAKLLAGLDGSAAARRDEIDLKYAKPVTDPVTLAGDAAAQRVKLDYATALKNVEDDINRQLKGRVELEVALIEARGDETDVVQAGISVADEAIGRARTHLGILLQRRDVQTEVERAQARNAEEASRTASAGWDKFFKEFEAKGRSSADHVYEALKGVTDKLESAWVEFGRTGKFSLKGILDSIRDSLFKQMFDDSIKPLIGQGLKGLRGLLGGGGSLLDQGLDLAGGTDAAVAANYQLAAAATDAALALQGLSGGAGAGGQGRAGGIGGSLASIGGSIWDGIGDAFISIFGLAKGGVVGKAGLRNFAKGGAFTNSIVSSPTLFRFAQGGAFQLGQMGEAGDEAVMPLERGPGGKLGVANYGGRQAPVTNITIVGAPAGSKVERKKNSTGGEDVLVRFKEAVKQEIADDVDNGVGLARNVGGRFGLNSGVGLVR